jgi:hypothetical protein
MPTPEECQAAFEQHGTNSAAAEALGVHERTLRRKRAKFARMQELDPGIRSALEETGISPDAACFGYRRIKDESGSFNTVMWKMPGGDEVDFKETIRETLEDVAASVKLDLPPRFETRPGNLLILDPADVHIGKLSVVSETGFSYDEKVAEHRLVEGSRMLMEWGLREGVTRVLFVIGNDISHIDTPRKTTTAGTPQDVSCNLFHIYRVAQRAYTRIARLGLEMGLDMDIMFVPSNHDWVLGFCVAQAIGAMFEGHDNVNASPYMLSEQHRKYYRFGTSLSGFSHGDGAAERDLPMLMQVEARSHISECPHLYFYLHHMHHKMRRGLGVRPQQREKDHIGMTVVGTGGGAQEGDNLHVEYIRSPSPPDGWHHRNGYINRQAVEAFIHHPHEGQVLRRTEWF